MLIFDDLLSRNYFQIEIIYTRKNYLQKNSFVLDLILSHKLCT